MVLQAYFMTTALALTLVLGGALACAVMSDDEVKKYFNVVDGNGNN
jgi:hypothetical protein